LDQVLIAHNRQPFNRCSACLRTVCGFGAGGIHVAVWPVIISALANATHSYGNVVRGVGLGTTKAIGITAHENAFVALAGITLINARIIKS
jgi:hypothetical protein